MPLILITGRQLISRTGLAGTEGSSSQLQVSLVIAGEVAHDLSDLSHGFRVARCDGPGQRFRQAAHVGAQVGVVGRREDVTHLFLGVVLVRVERRDKADERLSRCHLILPVSRSLTGFTCTRRCRLPSYRYGTLLAWLTMKCGERSRS